MNDHMIDFGFSHFLDNRPRRNINPDMVPDLTLGRELFPAYDFITLYRGIMSLILSLLLLDKCCSQLLDRVIKVMQIGSAMISKQIKALAIEQFKFNGVRPRRVDIPLDEVPILNDVEVSRYIYYTNDFELQEVIVKLVERFVHTAYRASEKELQRGYYVGNLLTGMYITDTLFDSRKIYITQLTPLTPYVRNLLSITEPVPDLTGIPLFLWYLNAV